MFENYYFKALAISTLANTILLITRRECAIGFLHPTITQKIMPPHPSRAGGGKEFVVRKMFTGIVEEMGTVVSLQERDDIKLWDGRTGHGTELVLRGNIVLEGAYLGCSICVNGVCLTVTELLENPYRGFKVGLAPETLRRTYFRSLRPGDSVNLERASEIGGRNSGHSVQGHVDGVGTIIDKWTDNDSLWVKVTVPPEILKYVVPKGFIAIDGTSLTVCEVDRRSDESWFTFMLVEYTQKKIIIPTKPIGGLVNIEVDVLAKYTENALINVLPRIAELEERVRQLEDKIKL
jgi:riboflavin synthase